MTYQELTSKYAVTIGIECHVQLKTKTKLFSGADNDARDKAPNTTVSPICFGFPGVLPVLNREAIRLAIRAGIALEATIPPLSRFERKHYFYPDLPKGYQITQLAEPIIVGGQVQVPQLDGTTKKVRIHHAHLEEDAGKLTHPDTGNVSLVDLNRAGTPLIEIVSEADIHSPTEARAYAQELYLLMTYADVTDGDLYHGNMRFDVNLSLAPYGATELGTRTEIKNLNSFRSVERAAEFEATRQAKLLESGEAVVQETRGWNEAKQVTVSQRSKEEAHDYRYMPEPDVPPVRVEPDQVVAIERDMPPLPAVYRRSWGELGLNSSVTSALLQNQSVAELLSTVQEQDAGAARRVANWFASGLEDESSTHSMQATAGELVALARLTDDGRLSSTGAKRVFNLLLREGGRAEQLMDREGLEQVSDQSALQAIIEQVLADPVSQQAVQDVRGGQDKAIGYLVGQCMKAARGQGNPAMFQQLLREKLK